MSGFRATLTIGGRLGLWEDLLLRWLPIFANLAPMCRAGIDRVRSGPDGRVDRGPHRYRRDVHAAGASGPHGRTAARRAPRHGVDRAPTRRSSRKATTSTSTGARNSSRSTAWRFRTSAVAHSRSTSAGSACSEFAYTAAPATSRCAWSARTNSPGVCIASQERLSSGCRRTCASRPRTDSQPLALALDTIRRVAADAA